VLSVISFVEVVPNIPILLSVLSSSVLSSPPGNLKDGNEAKLLIDLLIFGERGFTCGFDGCTCVGVVCA
jgi:hypothetical protein